MQRLNPIPLFTFKRGDYNVVFAASDIRVVILRCFLMLLFELPKSR